ncbi:MAG TPA: helix-hairpin-helix domain-containing protein [Kofleriaceae bacterium]|nr:helix-hairpin-helix domain-containing protein [Kofleriaceae bacterium]
MQLRVVSILALAAVASAARLAAANPYESFIDVDDEEDLYDLQATGQIDDETRDTLVEVMQTGIDINRASREELYSLPNLTYGDVDAILEYRKLAGWVNDPIDLVAAGVLSQQKLEAIAAFLVVTDPTRSLFATGGWVRAQTRWSVEDDDAPPGAFQARVTSLKNLTVGFASTFSRNRLADVEYDPERDALSAVPADEKLDIPKFFAKWETDQYGAIAGTYRIGFGQRLTFDNTSLYTPNGFYHDDQLFRDTELSRVCRESTGELDDPPCETNLYETPDYRWRDGLLGAAVGLKRLDIGAGHLQAFAFGSYQPRSIYQYELFNADACDDPHDEDCDAPAVYRRQADPEQDTSVFSFSTLPDLFTEMTAGGNVGYWINRRSHIGVTGYGGDVSFHPDGIALDFQEYSRLPYGGPFGAVGGDFSVGLNKVDLFGEYTRSFDSMDDGERGGNAGIIRAVTTFARQNELEASLRYYDEDFKNPYARPIAAPDEVDGSRARDEMGARLRYTARIDKRLSLRGTADVWSPVSGDGADARVDGRGDYDITDQYGIGAWVRYDQCIQAEDVGDEGDPDPAAECGGNNYQVTGRFRFSPTSRYNLVAQYQHKFLTEEDRQDMSATLIGTAKPTKWLRMRARSRYLSEDIDSDASLEESLWSYVDAGISLRGRDWLRVRYDLFVYLDDRESTQERIPSPEHWLWLEYESRF